MGPGVAQLYFDNVYWWFGLPSKIISDQDPCFTSHFGRALANKIGAKQNLSTAFHPQTDGLSERKNQWVEQYLRLVTSAQQEDWSQWLTVASTVHNDHVNTTLGAAPSEILLGYRPTLHPDQNVPSNNQTAEQRMETLHQKRTQAIAAINKVAKQGHIPEGRFKEGDQVWLEATNLKLPYHTPKLAPRRQGPFRISKVISPVAYQLMLPLSWGIHNIFHASLLLPYRETTTHGPNFTQPPPDLIKDEEEYEVETVINYRHYGRRRQLQYLIKWKSYPSSDNTWEAADDVHTDDLLKNYHRRHPLGSFKSRTHHGTKELARTLRLLTSSPSPTQKVVNWLLSVTILGHVHLGYLFLFPPLVYRAFLRTSASISALLLTRDLGSRFDPRSTYTYLLSHVSMSTSPVLPFIVPHLPRLPYLRTDGLISLLIHCLSTQGPRVSQSLNHVFLVIPCIYTRTPSGRATGLYKPCNTGRVGL